MDAGPRRAALTRTSLDSHATRKSDGIRCPMHVAPLSGALAELLFLPALPLAGWPVMLWVWCGVFLFFCSFFLFFLAMLWSTDVQTCISMH